MIAGLLYGCGGSKPSVQQESETARQLAPPDSISMQIFSLAQDTLLDSLMESWPRPVAVVVDTTNPDQEEAPADHIIYRIQLFTSVNFADAAAVRDDATKEFKQDVRVDFETPYYKVRVGSFKSAQDAEPLLQTARKLGYRGAWVVRVRAPREDD